MQKAKETAGQLVKAREDMTTMLDLVEKTLDQSPFTVAPGVILTRDLTILARRDDWDRPVVNDKGNEIITIEGAVCQNVRFCQEVCVNGFSSSNRKPILEADRQLVEDDSPVGDRHSPFLDNITMG
jgi:hypothetical protein